MIEECRQLGLTLLPSPRAPAAAAVKITVRLRDAWRPARGTHCVAADGHPCRSLAEQTVDNWLSRHGVEHDIEPLWPRHTVHNPHGRRRADRRLRDGTYIKYAGLTSDDYLARIQAKQLLARDTGITLVAITPLDLADLTELLGPWTS